MGNIDYWKSLRVGDPVDMNNQQGFWNVYHWVQGGEEWGTGQSRWDNIIHPRMEGFRLDGTTLEIACGFGRISQFLTDAQRLILVDIAPRCVEACSERFKDKENVEVYMTDGYHLDMVEDSVLDFAMSYDSLVHVQIDVMASYVDELNRKLKPGGNAWLHHSNLAALDPDYPNPHARNKSVSAELVNQICQDVGVEVVQQELIPWDKDGLLTDCFTTLRRAS